MRSKKNHSIFGKNNSEPGCTFPSNSCTCTAGVEPTGLDCCKNGQDVKQHILLNSKNIFLSFSLVTWSVLTSLQAGIHPDRQELAEDLSSHPDLLTGRSWPNNSITELKFSFKWLGYVWGRWCHASQDLAIFAPLIKSWIRVFFHNLNWDSVLYLAGKSTEQFQSELLIRQVMTTCKTSEGSTWQLGKPGICQLTEFRTN